jgi:arsenate reductase
MPKTPRPAVFRRVPIRPRRAVVVEARQLLCGRSVVTDQIYNVLFLCTGNSARSILAEVLINRWGQGKFKGFSAGSHPKGAVHPLALELLQSRGLPTNGLRSKSWDGFAQPGSPNLDFVFTVCDNAAGEVCPYWPGQPMTAHWGMEDPAAVEGTDAEKQRAFLHTYTALESRIKIFASLPLRTLDRIRLQERVDEIGKTPPPPDDAP